MDKQTIRAMLDANEGKWQKRLTLGIQALIILSLVSFSLATLPNLSPGMAQFLTIIEFITVVIFSIEYLLRIVFAKHRLRFVFSFYGLIDLMAILPFYIVTGLDLRAIRILRLFKLIRLLRLMKYNHALMRFHRALIIAKEELILFTFLACILFYIAAVGIYYFEHSAQPELFKSIFHCLWWAVITLTTVGYGDMYPITVGGKIFTSFILLLGLGIVAIPTGLIASALTKAREDNKE